MAAAIQNPSRKTSKVIVGLLKSSMMPVQQVISDSGGGTDSAKGGILAVTQTDLGQVLLKKGIAIYSEMKVLASLLRPYKILFNTM